jgi:hypothetical protein
MYGRDTQRSNSLTQPTATIGELEQEADRLANRLQEHMKDDEVADEPTTEQGGNRGD